MKLHYSEQSRELNNKLKWICIYAKFKKKNNITKFRMRVQLIGLIKSKQRGITGELDGDRWRIWNGLQERRVRSICSQGQRVNFD